MANLLSTWISGSLNSTGRITTTYNTDRYQFNFNRASASNWWVTNDSDKLGLHIDNVGDRFYFGTGGDFWSSANGWLSTALAAKQNASTAITTSNIGSQSVNYANSSGITEFQNIPDNRGNAYQPNDYTGQRVWWHFNNRDAVGGYGTYWHAIQTVSPWTSYDNSHRQQQIQWGGTDISFRYATSGTTWSSWFRFITDANIGSQSVSYASSAGNSDTLDSLDSSEFARGRAAYQVLNLDTIKQPGLYQYDGGIGGTQPEGVNQFNLRTIEIGSGGRYSQMAFDWSSEQAWFRRQTGDTWSAWREFIHSGNIGSQSVSYASSAGNADTTDGLHVHGGRNNEADKIVRTDSNGHIQAGWINTTSGALSSSTAPVRITASNDEYLRYYSLEDFKVSLGLPRNSYNRHISYSSTPGYHTGVMGHSNAYDVFNALPHFGSGFIDFWASPGNAPDSNHWVGVQSWHAVNWDGVAGRNYGWQLVHRGGTAGDIRFNSQWGDSDYGWINIWNSANDGAGSGLDADTVDGFHASVAANANTIPTRNASGYLIPESWIQLNGIYGLYSPTNEAHLRPNPNSYGSWLMTGSRNGWRGIEFDSGSNGNVTLMISNSSSESGFHNNGYGWQIKWSAGTLYIGKGTYGGSDATVWDSSNAPRANFDNLMYYQGFTLDANTMATNSTGFTYAVNAPFYGPIARFSTGGSYDLWIGGSYGGGGNAFYLRTRNGDNGTFNPWREIVTSGNIGSQTVSQVNQTAYNKPAVLLNSSGTSSTGASLGMQQVTGEGWTGIFVDFEPYTGWGLWHDNPNNLFSFTAEDSTGSIRSFTVPSRQSGDRTAHEKFRIDQNNGDVIVGRDGYAQSSFRAPIFYDSQNTAFYLDPNGTSNLNAVFANNYYANGWFRNYGTQGIYNESYGTHFYSNGGAAWVITGSGGNVELQFRSNHQSTLRGYVYADTSNQIGFLNNGGGWNFRTTSDRNAFVHGQTLTINADNAGWSSIYMNDGDEGMRELHCNSNRIGFLTQAGAWGSWCYDDGSWASGVAMHSPIYYDSADSGYYLDPNADLSLKVYGEICNSNYQPGRLLPGALNIGRTDTNYAWDGTSWADDIKLGILINTNETWEMGIHDSGDSVMSALHFDGGTTLTMGRNLGWGQCVVNVPAGYVSNGNAWGTNNSAFFPNGITTAGGTNWIYGFTYIGNAPANGNGHEFNANGTQYSTASITTPTFIVNSHSDNTRGYRIHNTSGTAVSAMFTNSSNALVIAAGAFEQINLNKKVFVNGVALGVNVAPSATAGRIDASNDIVAYSSSDERLKHNIAPIENALDKVKSLTGVEFDWKPEYKDAHGYEGHDTGIIAQQVEAVMPSAVRTNDTGFLAVRYEKLIGLLIEANKELAARVEELEKKLG